MICYVLFSDWNDINMGLRKPLLMENLASQRINQCDATRHALIALDLITKIEYYFN